jgi:hypothetical protein
MAETNMQQVFDSLLTFQGRRHDQCRQGWSNKLGCFLLVSIVAGSLDTRGEIALE